MDTVLITHADHDHYNLRTLAAIARAYPEADLITPPGLDAAKAELGFRTVTEVALWTPVSYGALRITPVPAVHYGRRDLLGFKPSPAFGYRFDAGPRSLFVAGDTAQGDVFSDIRKQLGPVQLAVLPIGAFAPEPLFGDIHVNPEGAIEIARQLEASRVLGYHWGTYQFGPVPPREIRDRFLAAGSADSPRPFVVQIGETVSVCAS